MANDKFGRNIHYLRVSLTDKCNLRCVYCMHEDIVFRPTPELMTDDEIISLVRLFAELGFDKYRLTGGEPTIRPHVVDIVREMKRIDGVRNITMTTNGILLNKLAEPLKQAGLDRVNISIDTLDPQHFKRLTRWGDFQSVWDGILAAEAAGLLPIKLNAVIVRGFNDGQDIIDLARLTVEHPWQVRYIEMMPFGDVAEFQQQQVVTDAEVRQTIESAFGPLELVNGGQLDGEARLYQIPGANGQIGLISSVTHPFCAHCTRARLTAEGVLRLCLLRDHEVDLLTPVRSGASLADLKALILDGVWNKPWGHGLAHDVVPVNRVMSQIGG